MTLRPAVLFLCLCICTVVARAQQKAIFASAAPADGWEALQGRIRYPEIMARARTDAMATVSMAVDSTGAILDLSVRSNWTYFEPAVERAIRATTWTPSARNGIPTSDRITFDIEFRMKTPGKWTRLVVLSDTVFVQTSH